MERQNKRAYFSASFGHWEHIFKKLTRPREAVGTAAHGLVGPTGTRDLCTSSSVQMCVRTVFPGEHRHATLKGTTLWCPGTARDQERPKSHDRTSSNLLSCLPFCKTRGKANASGLLGVAGSHGAPAAVPAPSPAPPTKGVHHSSQSHNSPRNCTHR